MAQARVSTKRLMINKSQSTIVLVTAIAAFIVVFTLFAAKALISQAGYQNRVISAKKTAVSQLKEDIQSTNALVASYQGFVNTPQNVLGGDPHGNGAQDGDNAKVVLDALPSKYDFPALATSLEKLILSQNLQIQSISGTDDEVAQTGSTDGAKTANPSPVDMPFQVVVTGNYQSMQNLIKTFGSSIRPFQIQTMQLAGDEGNMTLTLTAQTSYQPQKGFNVTTKVVR